MQYLSMVIFVLILLWNLQILRAEILLWQATNCASTIMLKKDGIQICDFYNVCDMAPVLGAVIYKYKLQRYVFSFP